MSGPSRSFGRRSVVIATVMLVMVPLLYTATRREIAKWYHAAALNATYRADHQLALEKIEKGLEWNPNDLSLLPKLAATYLGLSDAAKAAEVSDTYLEIVRDKHDRIASGLNKARLASALNLSAYSNALAKKNLEEALENVERSIELAGGDAVGSIDTRGYIHYLLGNYDLAVEDTEMAVSAFANSIPIEKAEQSQESQLFVDQSLFDYQLRVLDETLAVLLHHRGLAYEAVGKLEQAEKDFERAKGLGYSPENGVW